VDGGTTRESTGTGDQYAWTDPTRLNYAEGERFYRSVVTATTTELAPGIPGISETRCVTAPSPPASPPSAAPQPTPGSTTAAANTGQPPGQGAASGAQVP